MNPTTPTSPIPTGTPLYWLPCALTFSIWAGITAALLYVGEYVYDDHTNANPYKDSGFDFSFDWSNTDNGTFQRWMNEGYAIGHGALLVLFCLSRGRDRLTILRRLFCVSAIAQILFQGQMMSTRLPDPNPNEVNRRWRYIHMPAQYVIGGLLVQFYTGNWFLRGASWLITCGGLYVIVPTHYLYTVDLVTGIITGLSVFLVYHWQVRNTHAICKYTPLAWYELDFLRWHRSGVIDELYQSITRDEVRVRSDSMSTVAFVENLAVGLPVTEEDGSSVVRNDQLIAASLESPALMSQTDVTSTTSGAHNQSGSRTSGAEDAAYASERGRGSSVIGGIRPAYAAGGQDGFTRFGYSEDEPQSEFLMEHFQAPPYCIDHSTRAMTQIMDDLEMMYYTLPDGTISAASDVLGIIDGETTYIGNRSASSTNGGVYTPVAVPPQKTSNGDGDADNTALNMSPPRNGPHDAPEMERNAANAARPNHVVEIHISAESAAVIQQKAASRPTSTCSMTAVHSPRDTDPLVADGDKRKGQTTGGTYSVYDDANNNMSARARVSMNSLPKEGTILGLIRVSISADPATALAEKQNWIRRQTVIGIVLAACMAWGAGLALLNEVPIHIADANRPIGIPLPTDVLHQLLPKVPDHTPDFMMYPMVVVGFTYLFISRHRWTILRRTAIWYGLCMGGRCLTVPATFLPDASPMCREKEHPMGTTCGDMIYSGHTLTICAALSVIWKYVDPLWIRIGAGIYSFLCVLAIVCSRLHYTRDVFTALIVAFSAYHLVHRALVHRVDIYLNNKYLRYFEFDYFCALIEDRQLAREGKVRAYKWLKGGVGETFAQIADAFKLRRERKEAEAALKAQA